MKKKIKIVTLSIFLSVYGLIADPANNTDILKELEQTQKDIKELRDKITLLEKNKKSESKVELNDVVKNLKLEGALRLRYERIDQDYKSAGVSKGRLRDRYRYRLALGAIYDLEDNFQIGIRFNMDGGTGTNGTIGTGYGSPSDDNAVFGLDRAYASYIGLENLKITAGKMPNPFVSNPLIWDSDLNPEGLSVQYDNELLFLNLAAIAVDNDNWNNSTTGDDNANMFGAQSGINYKFDTISFKTGVGYYECNSAFDELVVNEQYNIDIGEAFLEVKSQINKSIELALFGKYVKNISAHDDAGITQVTYSDATLTAEDNDEGYLGGMQAKYDCFTFRYYYEYLEGDAVLYSYNNGDFLSNNKGHVYSVTYKLTKSLTFNTMYYDYKEIEKTLTDVSEQKLQVNFVWKF